MAQRSCTRVWTRALRSSVPLLVLLAATQVAQSAQLADEGNVPAEVSTAAPPAQPTYGVALRTRWVSVPGWLLDLFTAENVPLSSYGVGFELFRRKADFEVMLGFNWQKMSPSDGNWLGKGKDPSLDTDFVQARGLGLLSVDAAFLKRKVLNDYLALRWGAGLGIAKVTGKVLRTSAAGCTAANVGDERACRPIFCPPTGCTEALLRASEAGGRDTGPMDPHRFAEPDVPGAFPIINLVAGCELRHPRVPGAELRLEGGFYDAFFLGTTIGYQF